MALLYRFTQLPDRSGTRIFSFIVTRSVVRDPERDVTSKELVCGFQKWAVAFSRGDKVLGVYLVWRGAAPGLRVYVDFTFTLLNREHFLVNECFSGKRIKFTYEAPAHGNRSYISVSELYSRNFADPNGEFQLDLVMTNIRTIFATEVRIPTGVFTAGHSKPTKLETNYFTFGGFDWNLVVYPFGDKETTDAREGRLSIYLVRLNGFDHHCRVRYSIFLGESGRRIESGPLEDLSDTEGRGAGWHPRTRWSDVAHKGVLRITLEMLEARTISEILVQAIGPGTLPAISCYDKDKQAWSLRADLQSDTLRLHLIFKDIQNVTRNHLRYVSWTTYVVRGEDSDSQVITLLGAPFSRYYAQESADDGIIMESTINVADLKSDKCTLINESGQIRIRIEWIESHVLFQATYHNYDDVYRMHNQQMRKEINVLQSENYSLERQLFSYQKSLAYAQAQQQHPSAHPYNIHDNTSTPLHTTPSTQQPAYHPQPLPHTQLRHSSSTYHPANQHIFERSISTETEYA